MHSINLKMILPTFGFTLLSSVAVSAPWDVDMVDSASIGGYECWEYATNEEGQKVCVRSMGVLPEGVVAQANKLTPNHIMTPDYPKGAPEWDMVTSPFESSERTLATGGEMFNIYCTPCHGKVNENGEILELGPVAQPGRLAGVIPLTGKDGVLKNRSDGRVYSTIRKGSAIMPAYNWAMTDSEMWSLVAYVRTLDQSQYTPPVQAIEEDGGTQ